MYDEHVKTYRSYRYYNCRVTCGMYTYDPEDPCLTLSYDLGHE